MISSVIATNLEARVSKLKLRAPKISGNQQLWEILQSFPSEMRADLYLVTQPFLSFSTLGRCAECFNEQKQCAKCANPEVLPVARVAKVVKAKPRGKK